MQALSGAGAPARLTWEACSLANVPKRWGLRLGRAGMAFSRAKPGETEKEPELQLGSRSLC